MISIYIHNLCMRAAKALGESAHMANSAIHTEKLNLLLNTHIIVYRMTKMSEIVPGSLSTFIICVCEQQGSSESEHMRRII